MNIRVQYEGGGILLIVQPLSASGKMFCSVELVALDRSAANFEYRNEMYQITC
jgi:hypothetical protein